MSGGSYDYACFADAQDILSMQKHEDLEYLADALGRAGYADVAAETRDILATAREMNRHMQARIDRIADVWRAEEWHASCDVGHERVEQAVNEYREAQA